MRPEYKLILVALLSGALFLCDGALFYCGAEEGPNTCFFDRLGDLILFGKEKDIYQDRIDGGFLKKITNTPDIVETDAFFAYGGRYVVYKAEKKKSAFDKNPNPAYQYFRVPIDENDTKKKEIGEFEYRDYKKKRIREKNRIESERDLFR